MGCAGCSGPKPSDGFAEDSLSHDRMQTDPGLVRSGFSSCVVDSGLPMTPASPDGLPKTKRISTWSVVSHYREEGLSSILEEFQHSDEIPEEVGQIEQMRGRGAVSRVIALQPDGWTNFTQFMAADEDSPKTRLYAGDSTAPVQAIDCWGLHGCKIYTYSGLTARGDANDKATAVGVLMLDRYAIQERVGDPASPLTWWPYQAFFVIPKGVDFATCKAVGSAGKNAATIFTKETRTICKGLDALALVAIEEGKRRLFITGDCGYYSLAIPAYVQILLDMGWVKKGDACMNAPWFRVRDSIDVYLCLGTPQMIACPDSSQNIAGQADNCAIIYSTADLRGWYSGDTLDQLNAVYPSLDEMNEIMRFNEGIPWGMQLAWHPESSSMIWGAVADQLQEFEDGNIAFFLGMFVGWASKPVTDECDQGPARRQHWLMMPENAKQILEGLLHNAGSFREFYKPGILAIFRKSVKAGVTRKWWSGDPNQIVFTDLTSDEVISAFIIIMGHSTHVVTTGEAWVQQLTERTTATIKAILNFDEGPDVLPGKDITVTCAHRYCDWYCALIMRLNKTIIRDAFSAGKVDHAIDAKKVFLLDALYIPGFGKQVADGLTVWCFTTFYCWLSRIYATFAKLVQEDTKKPIVFHHECTELFQFTDFIQQFGMPCIDNPNYMVLASRSTNLPLKFRRWSYDTAPAAIMFSDGKWYRSSAIPLRTPDSLAEDYIKLKDFIYPDQSYGAEDKMWDSIEKGAVRFNQELLGSGPGQFLYIESTAIVDKYIGDPHKFESKVYMKGSVQYGTCRQEWHMHENDFVSEQ